MNIRWTLVALLTCIPGPATEFNLVYEDSGPDWAERYIEVPPRWFSEKRVRDLVADSLRPMQARRLVKIVVASDRQDLLNMRRGKALADFSYHLWTDVLEERLRARQPLAMALKVGDNAAFRYRDEAGRTTEGLVFGSNPFAVRGPSGDARILHLSFSRVPYGEGTTVHAMFFLETTAALLEPVAEDLALRLKRAVGIVENTITLLRRDSWFIENEAFPIFYPFGKPDTTPTLRDYVCTPTLICADRAGDPKCRPQEYRLGKCR